MRQAMMGLDTLLEDVRAAQDDLASVAATGLQGPCIASEVAAGAARSVEDAQQMLWKAQASLDAVSSTLQAAKVAEVAAEEHQQLGRPLSQSELWLKSGELKEDNAEGSSHGDEKDHERALEAKRENPKKNPHLQGYRPHSEAVAHSSGSVSEHATSAGTAEEGSYGGASADSAADGSATGGEMSPRLQQDAAEPMAPLGVVAGPVAVAETGMPAKVFRLGRVASAGGVGALRILADGDVPDPPRGGKGKLDVRLFRYMEASDSDVWQAQWVLEAIRLQPPSSWPPLHSMSPWCVPPRDELGPRRVA